jgi:hypothetical protein
VGPVVEGPVEAVEEVDAVEEVEEVEENRLVISGAVPSLV